MNLKLLKSKVEEIITDIKNSGYFLKENDLIDYKEQLTCEAGDIKEKILLKNFARDILSFANAEGGILMLGFREDPTSKDISDKGLDDKDTKLLQEIDINKLSDQLTKITSIKLSLDIQTFKIGSRSYGYILVEKSNDVLIPNKDFKEYNLKKGEVLYRLSGFIQLMNKNTSEFNRFIQIKSNEKSKEFMEIWSKLLPEMIDINPKEVLLLNPIQNKVYGFNSRDNTLSGGDIEIQAENNVFNIILQSIKAGDIGKIVDNEGKPVYKIIAETKRIKAPIPFKTVFEYLKQETRYRFNSEDIKKLAYHQKWVSVPDFQVTEFDESILKSEYADFVWSEVTNASTGARRIVLSEDAQLELLNLIQQITHDELISILDRSITKIE